MNADRMLFQKKFSYALPAWNTVLTDTAPGAALRADTKLLACFLYFRHSLATVRKDQVAAVEKQ